MYEHYKSIQVNRFNKTNLDTKKSAQNPFDIALSTKSYYPHCNKDVASDENTCIICY